MENIIFAALLIGASLLASVGTVAVGRKGSPNRGVVTESAVTHYDQANISGQLVPHLSGLPLSETSQLTFWAYDAHYFDNAKKCGKLCQGLLDQLERGATVEYIFSKAGVRPPQGLLDLQAEFGDLITIYTFSAKETDNKALKIAKTLKSLHPNLIDIDSAGSRAMWVEYDHPPNSTTAYDVRFYGPEAMLEPNSALEYRLYKQQLDYFKGFCEQHVGVKLAA